MAGLQVRAVLRERPKTAEKRGQWFPQTGCLHVYLLVWQLCLVFQEVRNKYGTQKNQVKATKLSAQKLGNAREKAIGQSSFRPLTNILGKQPLLIYRVDFSLGTQPMITEDRVTLC